MYQIVPVYFVLCLRFKSFSEEIDNILPGAGLSRRFRGQRLQQMADFLAIEPYTVAVPADIDKYFTAFINKDFLHITAADRAFSFLFR